MDLAVPLLREHTIVPRAQCSFELTRERLRRNCSRESGRRFGITQEAMRCGDRGVGDGLPDAWGAIDRADRDGDGKDRENPGERERSKDVPGIPALDDRRSNRDSVRDRLWYRAAS